MTNVYKIFVTKHDGKRPLGRPMCRQKNNNIEVGPGYELDLCGSG
jgi:hypothetical protein